MAPPLNGTDKPLLNGPWANVAAIARAIVTVGVTGVIALGVTYVGVKYAPEMARQLAVVIVKLDAILVNQQTIMTKQDELLRIEIQNCVNAAKGSATGEDRCYYGRSTR